MKRCSRCRELKNRSEFYNNNSACKICVLKQQLDYYHANKDLIANRNRERKYGLTLKQFLAMIKKQENKCLMCENEFKATPNVDHCHSTNRVRGLLCRGCNGRIGWFENNREKILRYI